MGMTTVHVTQKHIDNGEQCDGRECPIALAARDAFPDIHISVSHHYIFVDGKSQLLPVNVSRFIKTFDGGGMVKPFSFEVQ
jgi:hypothetical protein